jgi:hypothetical protein
MAYTGKECHAFCDSMAKVHREQERLKRRLNRCVHCMRQAARWDSLYCSDACKQAFHSDLRGEVR